MMQEKAKVQAPEARAIATDTTGLTEDEATRRLAQFGENALLEHRVSALERLLRFFWGPIPWMIEVAAALSAALQHWDDLAIILLMLFINAGVAFWQEFKADNAIALLKQQLALKARVKRDGEWKDIEARLLVPGDVVHVKLGNVVPADLRLIEGAYLSVDQSTLTGESLPVDKKAGDDAYSGSIAKQGEMDGVVTATGMNTYFGHTARLVQQAGTVSHFQHAVLRIGNFLILTTAGLIVIIMMPGCSAETRCSNSFNSRLSWPLPQFLSRCRRSCRSQWQSAPSASPGWGPSSPVSYRSRRWPE
jgi:H+-transporting ATPase